MSFTAQKLSSYFRCLRIFDSLGYVVVALIGAGSFFIARGFPAAGLLLSTFLVGEFLMSSIFVLNNRFDYSEDKVAGERKLSKNPISTGSVSFREADLLSLTLMLGGLLTVIIYFWNPFSLLLYLLAWSVGIMYSVPPFRFKSRAGLDILAHGAVVVIIFLLGYSFAVPLSPRAIVFAAPFFMLSTIYELRNHIKDITADSLAGLQTSVSKIGLRSARKILNLSIMLFWASVLGVGVLLGEGMTLLVATTILSYAAFRILLGRRSELLFDLHLWIMGGIYSGFRLLLLAGLL